MVELTFTLPIKTVSEANSRGDWRARFFKRTKPQREAAFVMARCALRAFPVGFPLPASAELTRVASRELDGDNLQGSLKAVRDGIADALGIKDNDPRVTWLYAQEKCKRGQYAVRVTVRGKA